MQAALLTSAALTAKVNILKESLERSENELVRAKKQLEDKEGAMAEVATLKEAVSKAKNSAALECTEREKQEAWVAEVRQELQALVEKDESLERDSKTRESELALALESAKTAKAEAQIEAMKKIAAGKAFFMQSKNIKVNYLLLTRIWSSPGAFADLPRSVSDAAAFYRAEEGSSMEKVFWS
nr:DNA ligase 1-like [Triticum aestivum]